MIPWTVVYQAPLVRGIFQAGILKWVAIPFSRGSSRPRDRTQVSCIACRFFTIWLTITILREILWDNAPILLLELSPTNLSIQWWILPAAVIIVFFWSWFFSTMRETQVRSPVLEDPLEKEMATHSSTLAWRIPWMEEPGRLQSMGSQRVGHNWATSLHSPSFLLHFW